MAQTGLKSPPSLTLVDLTVLSQQIEGKSFYPSHILTASELEQYGSYKYPKRKDEWLGGRLAVKQAAANFIRNSYPSGYLDWQTISNEYGRPFIKPVENFTLPAIEISISHSDSLCVAIASSEQCGIDIQKTSQAVVRVQEKFCSSAEKKLTERLDKKNDQEMQLTLLWSAKEALRKALGGHPLTGFLEMGLNDIKPVTDDCWTFSIMVNNEKRCSLCQVFTFVYQDYGCSVSFKQ